MTIEPFGNRVLVRVLEQESTTASGLVLPDTAKEKPQHGLIEALGADELLTAKLNLGDKILFAKYSGTEISQNGHTYLLLNGDDVLARIRA